MEATQWWSAEELWSWQLRQAEALLAHALDHVPYYRERLPAAGVSSTRPLTEEEWRKIPILRRTDVHLNEDALKSATLPRGHGRVTPRRSSGSSGRPVQVGKTEASHVYWGACSERDHIWHRRDLSGTFAFIRGQDADASYPDGQRTRGWGDTVFESGPAAWLRVDTPTAQQAEWLQRLDPDYLLTVPVNLAPLVEHCRATDIRLPRLRGVSTYGTTLHDELRAICREVWGVSIADTYSSEEVGYIALQCPAHEHYHVQAEAVIVEILDQKGQPCPPGAPGRVIVTPLHNFATPLLRYDIEDDAAWGEPCPCGRGLPVIRRILGRSRDQLVLPTGERVPNVFLYDLTRDLPVSQFQVAQLAPDHLEIRLVTHGTFGVAEEGLIRARLVERLPAEFRLTVSCLDEIPRSARGKYLDFTSELPARG